MNTSDKDPNKDSISVEIGADSAKVAVTGSASERAANTFVDLVSPFTEFAGIIGDHVRFFRQSAAIRALKRAKELADESDLKLNPVPPKFLIEWLENASREDDDEENLTELWAKLLNSASSNYSSAFITYSDLLSKLSKADAELLQFLAYDTSSFASLQYDWLVRERTFPKKVPKELKDMTKNPTATWGDVTNFIYQWGLQANCHVLTVGQSNKIPAPTKFYRDNELNISCLIKHGCLNRYEDTIKFGKNNLYISFVYLTKFGFDFVYACEGVNFEDSRKEMGW